MPLAVRVVGPAVVSVLMWVPGRAGCRLACSRDGSVARNRSVCAVGAVGVLRRAGAGSGSLRRARGGMAGRQRRWAGVGGRGPRQRPRHSAVARDRVPALCRRARRVCRLEDARQCRRDGGRRRPARALGGCAHRDRAAGLARRHVGARRVGVVSGGGARRAAGWRAALCSGDRARRARAVAPLARRRQCAYRRDRGSGGDGSPAPRCSIAGQSRACPRDSRRLAHRGAAAARARRSRAGSAITPCRSRAWRWHACSCCGASSCRCRWRSPATAPCCSDPGPARPGCSIGSHRRATWCASPRWRRRPAADAIPFVVSALIWAAVAAGLWLDSAACASRRRPAQRSR